MSTFRFKKFDIQQDQTTMKVGTDGVLLAAWVSCENAKNILDIGSGTGVISLILAQRNSLAKITAIEIDDKAAKQSQDNFSNSRWHSRLKLIHKDFKDFSPLEKFDLIVSNPPFFNATFKNENEQRSKARHQDSLTFETLLKKTKALLTENGTANFIIPFQEKDTFIQIAHQENLFPNRITYLKGTAQSKTKRVLLSFTQNQVKTTENELIIEISRHNYTKEYIELTKEFYLNM